MLSLTRPTDQHIQQFIDAQSHLSFSYPQVGCTRTETPPPGYKIDHNAIQLGEGATIFEQAKAALRRWQMFQMSWLTLCWQTAPIAEGTTVALLAKTLNLYFLNACRIVYTLDEPHRFGFGYGTLPDHIARGEERFLIEWREDDSVWYSILAYSQPQHILAKIGYPYMRLSQQRFARASKAAMQHVITS